MTRRREKAPQATGTRRAAREFVFRVLFEADRGDLPLEAVFARSEGAMLEGDDTFTPLNPDALAFAGELVRGLASTALRLTTRCAAPFAAGVLTRWRRPT